MSVDAEYSVGVSHTQAALTHHWGKGIAGVISKKAIHLPIRHNGITRQGGKEELKDVILHAQHAFHL